MEKQELIDIGELISGEDYIVNPQLANYSYSREVKQRLLNYLRSGACISSVASIKPCDFCDEVAGIYKYYSKGKWIWADWLIHYVEVHNLRLPEEFLKYVIEDKDHKND